MRRRSSTTLPPDVARELAALDAALAGEPVAADLADLGALALTLRDDRPVAAPGFSARLDDRAAAGFPRAERPAPARRRRTWAGLGIVASGAAAAVLAVTVIGGGSAAPTPDRPVVATAPTLDPGSAPNATAGSPGPTATTVQREAKASPAQPPLPSDSADSALAPSVLAPPAGASTGAVTRSVERGASLRLATAPKRLDEVVSGVLRVTDLAGGYVMSSSVDARPGAGGGAAFDLRIPATRLQGALAQLSQLAHVRSRTQNSFDVTAQVGSAAGRVAALRAARRSLLRQLAAGPGAAEAAALRARLRSVDRRLAQAKAVRADLRRRTTYSTVAVQVVTERPQAVTGGGSWTPRDALHDAGRVLAVVLGALLVGLAALLPFALLAAVLWPLARAGRRRRREHALDGA